jgi:DNA polymerase-3 subunit beta
MKISLERSVLLAVLSVVVGVVERRHTLPILGNFLLVAENDELQVRGTDLEIEISSTVPASVMEEGAITLPARKLVDIVRSLPEGEQVDVKSTGERASVACGKSRFVLGTLGAADFPSMDIPDGRLAFSLKRETLRRLLDKTSFAMAHQDVRYYLNGVLLELADGRIVAVATDGHRLAKAAGEVLNVDEGTDARAGEITQVIVPAKTVLELKRLLTGAPEQIQIEISDRTLRLDFGNTIVASKLVEGQYPDYNRVIPTGLERRASLDKELLRAALQRTAILSNEKYKGVRVTFEDGRLLLQSQNPEKEEAEDEIGIEYQGDKVSVGFNVGYVLDVISAVDVASVDVDFRDAESSAVWQGKGSDDEVFVIMPMRL